MRVLYLLVVLLIVCTGLYGQPPSEISLLSPKAASILKYGDYPPAMYNGMVDITVPVYTIEAHGFKVPIEFKYYASGIKYDDTSNEVGLGWSFIAGGLISRSVNGAPDGTADGTFSRDVSTFITCPDANSSLDNDYVRIRQVEAGASGEDTGGTLLDGEMDTYSFSFLNHSGSFCFPYLNSEVEPTTHPTGGNALFMPANGLRIVNCTSQMIEVLDTEGVYYKFEVKDKDQNIRFKEFYITQIISADKVDTVDFTYEVVSVFANAMRRPDIQYSATITTTTYTGLDQGGPPQSEFSESGGVFIQYMRPPRLTRIDFPGGYATFDYAIKNDIKTWDLRTVKVYNNTGTTPFRTISLSKSAFANGEQRLDKVSFNPGMSNGYDYQFGYNGSPASLFTQGTALKGIDFWGYFNGESVPYEKRYAPYFPGLPYGMGGATTNRAPNAAFIQTGILNKIVYPTKGYSEFRYELHRGRFSASQPVVECGGLRVSEIRNYLPDGTLAERKWYRYGTGESGVGITNTMPPDPIDFQRKTTTLHTYRNNGEGGLYQVIYKDTYMSFPRVSYLIMGSPVVYPIVTEYIGNNTEAYGKTVYEYEVFTDQQLYSENYTYRLTAARHYARTNQWRAGNLAAKTVSKKKSDGTYDKVYYTRNEYMDINKAEFRNVHVMNNIEFTFNFVNTGMPPPDIKTNFCGGSYEEYRRHFGRQTLCPYDYYNYYTTSGLRVLTKATEEIDGVATVTYYSDHNVNGLPSTVTSTSSTGDNVVTTLKYPTDFLHSPYSDMKSANILTPVIEKSLSKNGVLQQKEITTYGYLHSSFFAPLSYAVGHMTESPVVRQEYKYGAMGNLRQLSKDGVVKNVYLWGYNGRYPIANIQNATYDQIQGILNQTLIDRVAGAAVPASADLTAISNLRTNAALPGALVTTYSYVPLIGMTSQTDANGNTSSYELDLFSRLVLTRNSDGSIVQRYEYIYKK